MKIVLFLPIFLVVLLATSPNAAQNADSSVILSVFVDGKRISRPKLKLEIFSNRVKSKVDVKNGVFSTEQFGWLEPDNRSVDLNILYSRYRLEFANLTKGHLIGSWRIFIENPPFKYPDEIPDVRRADYIYRIEFNSGDALGTVIRKTKYKD